MRLSVNGEDREVGGATIPVLLADAGVDADAPFVAVAVNDAVIPRDAWRSHQLTQDDRVEIVAPVQGG